MNSDSEVSVDTDEGHFIPNEEVSSSSENSSPSEDDIQPKRKMKSNILKPKTKIISIKTLPNLLKSKDTFYGKDEITEWKKQPFKKTNLQKNLLLFLLEMLNESKLLFPLKA